MVKYQKLSPTNTDELALKILLFVMKNHDK